MTQQKLFEMLKDETDTDAIGMILSHCADYGHPNGAMVSVKRFAIVAAVLLEWWKEKSRWQPLTTEKPKGKVLLKGTNSNGKTRVVIGEWIAKQTLEVDPVDFFDYDEINDEYFAKEGWYEYFYSKDEYYLLSDLNLTHYQEIEL